MTDAVSTLGDEGDIGYLAVIGDQPFGLLDVYGEGLSWGCLWWLWLQIIGYGWGEFTAVDVLAQR
jgi:hypothetical protein